MLLTKLRLAVRQIRRSPLFSTAVVLTLTLAIGINTAVFSMLDGFLLRRLPYLQPDGVAAIVLHREGIGSRGGRFSEEDDILMAPTGSS